MLRPVSNARHNAPAPAPMPASATVERLLLCLLVEEVVGFMGDVVFVAVLAGEVVFVAMLGGAVVFVTVLLGRGFQYSDHVDANCSSGSPASAVRFADPEAMFWYEMPSPSRFEPGPGLVRARRLLCSSFVRRLLLVGMHGQGCRDFLALA